MVNTIVWDWLYEHVEYITVHVVPKESNLQNLEEYHAKNISSVLKIVNRSWTADYININIFSGRGWTKISRQCGSRSDTGVAWGCNWMYESNGVFKEICYCEDRDGCNGANHLSTSYIVMFILPLFILIKQLL